MRDSPAGPQTIRRGAYFRARRRSRVGCHSRRSAGGKLPDSLNVMLCRRLIRSWGAVFWPAVVAFFRNRYGVDGLTVCPEPDGEEHWDVA
jgi:hypothetical protein